jgi:tetratricopeptide (TPR) repeat protein
MKIEYPRSRYGWHVIIIMLLSIVLSLEVIASAFDLQGLLWISAFLDNPPHTLSVYLLATLGLLLFVSVVVYVVHLVPLARKRPRFYVFENFLAPCLYGAAVIVGTDIHKNVIFTPMLSYTAAPAALFLPGILVLAGEQVLTKLLRKCGRFTALRNWRKIALSCLFNSLRWDPGDVDTIRECGLLFHAEDEFTGTLQLLERLGAIETIEDDKVVRALDHCYRATGQSEMALRCLIRLREQVPEELSLDQRILDDYMRLEKYEEALDILDSGCLKENLQLIKTRQKILVQLGRHEEALDLIPQIAAMDSHGNNQSIRLCQDLLGFLPGHVKQMRILGGLLISEDSNERRAEGAEWLKKSYKAQTQQLDLARQLADYFLAEGETDEGSIYLKHLVAAGDSTPEYYLKLAHIYHEKQKPEKAAKVLARMTEILPDDWRGHLRLARALYAFGELDEAEKELEKAAEASPEDAEGSLQHLRNDIELKRREDHLNRLTREVMQRQDDVGKRLTLVEEMIGMEWMAKAVAQCDQLLEEKPELMPQVENLIRQGIQNSDQTYLLRDYLGDLYFQQGRYSDLLQLYREMAEDSMHGDKMLLEGCERILSRVPDHLETRMELALTCRETQDWEGVLDALGPLIENDKNRLEPADRALWVEAAYRSGSVGDAMRVGMPLADELSDEPGFMLMLIDILSELDEFEQAYEIMLRAREANPEDKRITRIESAVGGAHKKHRLSILDGKHKEEGLTGPEHFEKAELHSDLGQIQDAIVHFQRAADDKELAQISMAKMAVNLCNRGMYDLAAEMLDPIELTRELDDRHPDMKEMFYVVSRILERIKSHEQALQFYKRIFYVDASYRDIVKRLERLS